jgi:hypothetical protein
MCSLVVKQAQAAKGYSCLTGCSNRGTHSPWGNVVDGFISNMPVRHAA